MQSITNVADLRSAIAELELKQTYEKLLLKDQFLATCESLKPANLIQNLISDLPIVRNFKGTVAGTAIGMAAGYLSKKIVFGSSHNPIKQFLGTLLQMGITSVMSKNSEGIKSTAAIAIENLMRKKEHLA